MELPKIIQDFSISTNLEGRIKLEAELAQMSNKRISDEENLKKLKLIDLNFFYQKSIDLERQEKVLSRKGIYIFDKMKARQAIKAIQLEVLKKIADYSILKELGIHLSDNKLITSECLKIIRSNILDLIDIKEKDINESLHTAEEILNEFNKTEMKRFYSLPITMDEMGKIFTETSLASLSLEDYIATLGKFPGNVLTHVVRQGVRDHKGMIWHTAGIGEVHDGFKGILKRGKLLNTLEVYKEMGLTLPEAVGEAVLRYKLPQIDDNSTYESIKTREEVLYYFHQEMENPYNEPSDIGGHFSPLFDKAAIHFGVTEVLDHLYGGEECNECFLVFPQAMAINHEYQGTLFQWNPTSYHNDVGLLPIDGKGISLESAIIFLPGNAQVDPVTGSKYKTQGNKVVINDDGEYAMAENTVSSKEYWTKYIEDNCKGLSLKVVYYDIAMSPTDALCNLLKEYGIKKPVYGAETYTNNEDKKKQEDYYKYMSEKGLDSARDITVKSQIANIIDEKVMEKAINDHFDELEKNPFAKTLLEERDKHLRAEGMPPYERHYVAGSWTYEVKLRPIKTIEQYLEERKKNNELYGPKPVQLDTGTDSINIVK